MTRRTPIRCSTCCVGTASRMSACTRACRGFFSNSIATPMIWSGRPPLFPTSILSFHGAGGICRFGASRCCLALGLQFLGLLAVELEEAPTVHLGIEHFQGPTAGVDLVVMGEIGEAFEDAEQILVPEARQGLEIADAAR